MKTTTNIIEVNGSFRCTDADISNQLRRLGTEGWEVCRVLNQREGFVLLSRRYELRPAPDGDAA